MLLIEAVANTLLLVVAIGVTLVLFNKVVAKVVENSFAKIAKVEASHLDEQLRLLQEREL